MSLPPGAQRFIVCSGGGAGVMEAANRGAADANGRSIGLNIGLPHEQRPNPYITRELTFEFHYFFMRKLWFAHLARAMIAFPGGAFIPLGRLARADAPGVCYASLAWARSLAMTTPCVRAAFTLAVVYVQDAATAYSLAARPM